MCTDRYGIVRTLAAVLTAATTREFTLRGAVLSLWAFGWQTGAASADTIGELPLRCRAAVLACTPVVPAGKSGGQV